MPSRPCSVVAMTVRRSELRELECEVLVQALYQLPLWRSEPALLVSQQVDHTAVAQFSDEWGSWQVFEPIRMRDG